jgi:hypothetical protein
MTRIPLAALLAVLLPIAASAQVYRCDTNGRTVYSQAPCAENSVRIDLRPNSEVSMGAREAALLRENEMLREENARLRAELDIARQQETGRTEYDLRAEQAESFACKQAMRSYEISASTRSYDVEQKRIAVYAACGMREPVR